MQTLPALQFDFLSHWRSDIVTSPAIAKELLALKDRYIDMMYGLYEDGDLGEEPRSRFKYLAANYEAEADYDSYHWLREKWGAEAFVDLSLAIAAEFYPDQEFEIIENGDVHTVVSNQSRTLVFDLACHDQLSAETSLALAGDTRVAHSREALVGMIEHLEMRTRKHNVAIEKMKRDLESKPAQILSIHDK